MLDLNKLVTELAAKKKPAKKAAKKAAKKPAKKAATKKATKKKETKSAVKKTDDAAKISPARQEQIDRAAKAGVVLTKDDLLMGTPALKGIVTAKIAKATEDAALEKAAKKAPIYFAVAIIGEDEDDIIVNFNTPPMDAHTGLDRNYIAPKIEDIERLRTAVKGNSNPAAYLSRYVLTYRPKGRSTYTLPLVKAPAAFRDGKAPTLTAKVKAALATAIADPKQFPVNFPRSLAVYLMRAFAVHKGNRIIMPDGYKIGLPVHGPVVVYPIQINTHYYQNDPDVLADSAPRSLLVRLRNVCHQVTPMAQVAHMQSLGGLNTRAGVSPLFDKVMQIRVASRDEKEIAQRIAGLYEEARSALQHSTNRDNPTAKDGPFAWATNVDPEKLLDLLYGVKATLKNASMMVADRAFGSMSHAMDVARGYGHWRDVYLSLMREGLSPPPKPEPIVAQTPAVDSAGLPSSAADDAKPADPLRPKAKRTSPTSVPSVPKDKGAQEQFKKDNGDAMDGLYTAAVIGDTVDGIARVVSSL